MLSVFFGNDVIQVRQKAFAHLEDTAADALITHLTSDTYEKGIIVDLAEGVSLFGSEQVCVIDTSSDDAEVFESVLECVPLMAESPNHFMMIETTLTAPNKRKLQAHAETFTEISTDKKEKFNTFLLTDAFLRRDKKSLWLLLIEAWRNGSSNEEIIGILFWQIKILRLVERSKSAEESGQKPFVYSKAKKALQNFTEGELDTHSRTLLSIYHNGHLGKHDIALALEKWVLTI